jgi:hypothetical protein
MSPRCILGIAVFEFRLRILDGRERETDPISFLGIVEGFPEILVHATSVEQAERDLVNALEEHLKRLMDRDGTWLQLDDFPTVRAVRLHLTRLGA